MWVVGLVEYWKDGDGEVNNLQNEWRSSGDSTDEEEIKPATKQAVKATEKRMIKATAIAMAKQW